MYLHAKSEMSELQPTYIPLTIQEHNRTNWTINNMHTCTAHQQ